MLKDNGMNTDADVAKSWVFYWLTGQREALAGATALDALNRAGYGAGAVRALDFFMDADSEDVWVWDPDAHNWVKTLGPTSVARVHGGGELDDRIRRIVREEIRLAVVDADHTRVYGPFTKVGD